MLKAYFMPPADSDLFQVDPLAPPGTPAGIPPLRTSTPPHRSSSPDRSRSRQTAGRIPGIDSGRRRDFINMYWKSGRRLLSKPLKRLISFLAVGLAQLGYLTGGAMIQAAT